MSAYDFCSDLYGASRVIHPEGGPSAVQKVAREMQSGWPEIGPDTTGNWGAVIPEEAVLNYRSSGRRILIRIFIGVSRGTEEVVVLLEFRIENPPEVRKPYLQIIEWLMTKYGMECRPGFSLLDPPSDEDFAAYEFSSFQEALPLLNMRMDRMWEFWRKNMPERCGIWREGDPEG